MIFVRISHHTLKLQPKVLYPIIHRMHETKPKTVCGRRACLQQFDEAQLDEMLKTEQLKACDICFPPEDSIHRRGVGGGNYLKTL